MANKNTNPHTAKSENNDEFFFVKESESGKKLCITNSMKVANDFKDKCGVIVVEDGVIRRLS